MNKAIEHMTIAQAIDEGMLDEDFFEDTDDRQELIRKVTCYHRVNTDLELFTSKMGTMCLKDQNIIRPYLLREKSMDDLAVDLGIDYRSAVKHVYMVLLCCVFGKNCFDDWPGVVYNIITKKRY